MEPAVLSDRILYAQYMRKNLKQELTFRQDNGLTLLLRRGVRGTTQTGQRFKSKEELHKRHLS